jgi:hypothetical protein
MSLPWIKLWTNLPEHPKADRLEALLGVPRAWTHLVQLWLWVAKVKPDGDLSGIDPAVIAKRSGWDGSEDKFLSALTACGFLDPDGRLHDWDGMQGAHIAKAASDRERARRYRERRKDGHQGGFADASRSVTRDVTRDGRDGVTVVTSGEEMRLDERREEGGAGGNAASAATRSARTQRRPSHATLQAVREDTRPDGSTWEEHWQHKYPELDGRGARPSIADCLAEAWDHAARRKRENMPTYLESWLRREARSCKGDVAREQRYGARDEGGDWEADMRRGLAEVTR